MIFLYSGVVDNNDRVEVFKRSECSIVMIKGELSLLLYSLRLKVYQSRVPLGLSLRR